MTTPLLRQLAERVADARDVAAGFDQMVSEKRAAFDAANAELLRQQAAARARRDAAEQELRALALATYQTTREKNPAPGVVVKVGQSLVYDDALALAWAHETGLALVPESVDRKALEKIAKATPLPFVSYEEKPVVTLATDMEAALFLAGPPERPAPEPVPEAAPEPVPF